MKYIKAQCSVYRPKKWLFAGQDPEKHLPIRAIEKVMPEARVRANLFPFATVHTLRYSFATHLLEHKLGAGLPLAVEVVWIGKGHSIAAGYCCIVRLASRMPVTLCEIGSRGLFAQATMISKK